MGLPATLAISNYLGKNDNETWITLRKTNKVPLGKGGTFSHELGTKTVINFENKQPSFKMTPALQLQYVQNLTNNETLNLKIGTRFRASDEVQGREFTELDCKINDKFHVGANINYTVSTKGLFNMDAPTTYTQKAAGFVTASCQITPKLKVWCDPYQGTYDLDKHNWSHSSNFGITYKF